MTALVSLFTIGVIAVHLLLLLIARIRRSTHPRFGQLVMTISLSLVSVLFQLLPTDILLAERFSKGVLIWAALIVTASFWGDMVLHELHRLNPLAALLNRWRTACMIWGAVFFISILGSHTTLGEPGWLTALDAAGVVVLLGLALTGAVLIGASMTVSRGATMPEVFNRGLFWLIITAILLTGMILSGSGSAVLALAGLVLTLVALAGATYVHISYRVLDLGTLLEIVLRTLITTLLAATAIMGALALNRAFNTSEDPLINILILGFTAFSAAALYAPLQQLAELLFDRVKARFRPDTVAVTGEFNRRLSQSSGLDGVVESATETLNRLLRVKQSALVLVNDTGRIKGKIELLAMGVHLANSRGLLDKSGSIYKRIVLEQIAFQQFELEFGPSFQDAHSEEIDFFKSLRMGAYVPVTVEKQLIGILACGWKTNGAVFYQHDIELLMLIAQQIGIALRNARLIDDLQHLNASMRSLNNGLAQAKQELEKLDSVKTDFITIASHELRTPLAQIRGYTDIIDALNEQGMLDQPQTSDMMANLRKATARMEELISAMLDVSQLDVNAMDLRFLESSPEAVIRMAIEPLTDAIKTRRLFLTSRGLRGLPFIQSDLQRLVQAFRNVIVNAIKFTPDGGSIEINGELRQAQNANETDSILFSIKDTGVGIDARHIELIFDKFYRGFDPALHSTGAYKFMGAGPGLGLTIARGIIEGHGGKIWAESPGHDMNGFPGSTFYVLLPLVPPKGTGRVLPMEEDKIKRQTREQMTIKSNPSEAPMPVKASTD